ncbi:MAG TPA: Hpt domain-containing protein, partial [Candidatus Wallbacteria bacterium]|nr:Hpt domain-containing protein [Candidatus Wallbacteria bacterium]
KVEIDSDINRDTMLEIALCSQGKLIDAFNNNKPVYEIGLMLDKDIIKSQKSRFDIYQNVKSCGELIFIIPMTAAVPKNLRDFSPETFDMCVKFFLISNMTQAEIAKKLNIDDTQIHAVGITVKEEPGPAPVETPVFEEIELLEDYETFAMDTQKNISAMSHSIMTLEENRSDTEAINEIFRAVHTLKSATAMLGIKNMSDVAHILESMLDRVRNGLEIIDEERIDLLFEVLKFFEECLKSIKNGIKPTLSNSAVKERINKLKYDAPEKKLIRTVDVKTEKFHVTSYENLVIKEKIAGGMKPYTILVEFVADLPMKMVNAFLLFKNLKDYGEVVKTIPTMEEIDNGNFEMHFKILYLASYMEDEFRKALASEEIKNYVVSVYDEI